MQGDRRMYRLGFGLAAVAAFMLVWMGLGVGIIGRDGDPANMLFAVVLATGIVGSLIARFRPHGMSLALAATAAAQAAIGGYAVLAGLGRPYSGALELMLLNGFFVALFLGSAWLFRRAAA